MRILRLDGLRAVAVLCVVLHHHDLLDEGWIGVELFFVLSGFLITAILRRTRDQPAYWRRFYIKRAARILPPLLLVILFVSIAYHPPILSVAAYALFLGNFAAYTKADVSRLGVLWSLAVEEHFYLMFPFAVRFLERRQLMQLLLGVIVVEPLLRCAAVSWIHFHSYFPTYCWTIFHLDGLAMGAMLALLAEDGRAVTWMKKWSGLMSCVLASIFFALQWTRPAVFNREANTHMFNLLGYTLISAASMGIVAYTVWHPDTMVARFLEGRSVVFIGSISYGLYLYHVPVLNLLQEETHRGAPPLFPWSLAAVVLLAWLSFRFYERPVMAWGHRKATQYAQGSAESSSSLGVPDARKAHDLTSD